MALRIAGDNLDRLGLHEDARRAHAMAGSQASVWLGYRCLRALVEKIEHEYAHLRPDLFSARDLGAISLDLAPRDAAPTPLGQRLGSAGTRPARKVP